MVRHIPGKTSTHSSSPFCFLHICPLPAMKNQISSTLRWVTAFEVLPGPSSKWAIPPVVRPKRTRTSEPSGATASGAAGRRLVANVFMILNSSTATSITPSRRWPRHIIAENLLACLDERDPKGCGAFGFLAMTTRPRPASERRLGLVEAIDRTVVRGHASGPAPGASPMGLLRPWGAPLCKSRPMSAFQ